MAKKNDGSEVVLVAQDRGVHLSPAQDAVARNALAEMTDQLKAARAAIDAAENLQQAIKNVLWRGQGVKEDV